MKNKILLYDLSGKNNVRFSPPCWNVKLCLINNNIDFDTIPIRFTEKNKLSFSNQTLVPIIKYNEEVIFDSWKIFVWLNDKIKETAFAVKENKDLKAELEKFKNKEFQVEFLKNQNDSLRKILESDIKIKGKSILAKVLLDKDSPFLKSIVINRGSKSGINKGMPVVDGNYLVGKIVEVNYLSSRVLLLNDLNSRIPITFGEDSVQAILSGKGESKPVLEYLPELYEPYGNLTVFTSGKDGIFLPGIPVGKTEMDELDVNVNLFSDPNQLSFVTVQLINISKDNF